MAVLFLISVVVLAVHSAASLEIGVAPAPYNCPPVSYHAWEDPNECDRYVRCENGTVTDAQCPNGLVFSPTGGAYDFCDFNWRVDCGKKRSVPPPVSSPGCYYQWGLYPADNCVQYVRCEFGTPYVKDCEPGLAYDDRSKTCNWPDLVDGCDPESIVGFRCPDKSEGLSAKFEPFPRYPHPGDCTKLITCVNQKPRLISCGYGTGVSLYSLTCEDHRDVPECKAAAATANVVKKK
ncbi:protein obstructor-E [Galendromus occidentalis]|uniref:Protein obstructor-E n=1 Tax=Galendromus occidentalis TaxID=34638 RepID=A0AAJ6QSN2_9ACAR|nr:protein obstructor-E [Galendromus occidentalis]